MKLFCVVLVIYVVALTLLGVEGRGGGTTNGLEEPKFVGLFKRARRHALDLQEMSPLANEPPPPPPQIRSRRDALEEILLANEEPPPPPHFRPRRQMPPGMPPPPDGLPPPPQFLIR
ncbi:hypothetical protein KR009_011411 [Drosophila setifemur]|nr:hypothetical protein KR009_011411 [Drosophila setifemur]